MQSKFGWLIAGPVNNSDQNDNVYFDVTNLIIDGIHDESEMSLNYERVEQDELVNTLKNSLRKNDNLMLHHHQN